MKIIITILIIIVPILMYILRSRTKHSRSIFNAIAVISLFIFSIITATSIYEVLITQSLFTTKIHGIFLNPFFLITGSYLGIYIIYLLISLTITEMSSLS